MKTQEKLVKEEQEILNDLIHDMDNALMQLDESLTRSKLRAKKAKSSCLPEAYGQLVSSIDDKIRIDGKRKNLKRGKDELYETRLVLDILDDEEEDDSVDVKIGLHTYLNGHRIFIMSWKMPLCRHYILDNAAEEYEGVVIGKNGEEYRSHYQLQLKRQVKILFDKVQSVTHFFPELEEEAEKVIADEFLQELLKRRSGQEFKNIVFSIQKKQGEIIQTPFKQDLIVQGCAGSGKSMIMLHRLPIVLYDNPNSLDRNNLYIITPSIAYIQMANNMRYDLEIDDLKMGTLEQYYNHVLAKYNCNPEVYGTIKPYLKLNAEDLAYVYSADCVKDIQNKIEEIIEAGVIDCSIGYTLLNITEQKATSRATTPAERIRREALKIQTIINANDTVLRSYHRTIYDLLDQLEVFARMLESRKRAVTNGIMLQIKAEERNILDKKKDLEKITNLEEHQVMYQNRLDSIKAAQEKIADLEETRAIVELDDEYFEKLQKTAKRIRQILSLFAAVKRERGDMSIDDQYKMILNRQLLCVGCNEIIEEAIKAEDPYWEYANSISTGAKKIEPSLRNLEAYKTPFLPFDYLQEFIKANDYFLNSEKHAVHTTYLSMMKRLGQEPNDKGRLDALACSPYLYLQILYIFFGAPNSSMESLITIDEAQNIAPEELRLIKAVNGNRVVLNLFGDVKQHVEGSKGVDDWKQFSNIANFKKEYMQENYRNARQITEYCNKRFKLKMRAINLDGAGVHEILKADVFKNAFTGIFQKPQNVGLSCILVKNKEEADSLMALAGINTSKIHNMVDQAAEVKRKQWNMMTAEQAKGLEFETVFAVSGRMSENEKYIAYTRALNELYLYDEEIELSELPSAPDRAEDAPKETGQSTRRKRTKRTSAEQVKTVTDKSLREFFEEKGLKVIDDRKKSGHLWVIGSKNEISDIVDEAIEIYGASGNFGAGKMSGYKEGWFTKSKK